MAETELQKAYRQYVAGEITYSKYKEAVAKAAGTKPAPSGEPIECPNCHAPLPSNCGDIQCVDCGAIIRNYPRTTKYVEPQPPAQAEKGVPKCKNCHGTRFHPDHAGIYRHAFGPSGEPLYCVACVEREAAALSQCSEPAQAEKCPTCGSSDKSERWCELAFVAKRHPTGCGCKPCTNNDWHKLTDREREDVTNPVCDPNNVPDYQPQPAAQPTAREIQRGEIDVPGMLRAIAAEYFKDDEDVAADLFLSASCYESLKANATPTDAQRIAELEATVANLAKGQEMRVVERNGWMERTEKAEAEIADLRRQLAEAIESRNELAQQLGEASECVGDVGEELTTLRQKVVEQATQSDFSWKQCLLCDGWLSAPEGIDPQAMPQMGHKPDCIVRDCQEKLGWKG